MQQVADKIKMHIRENLTAYIILFVFFVLGTVLGGYITGTYNKDSVLHLKEFFDESFGVFKGSTPDYNSIFKNTFASGVSELLFVWILGFTVIGLPVIFFISARAGFMLGFVGAFTVSIYSWKGILITLSLIGIKCLIYIPFLFLMSAKGISVSLLLTKMLFGKIRYRSDFKYTFLSYLSFLPVMLLVLILYSLLEAYLSANLIALIV